MGVEIAVVRKQWWEQIDTFMYKWTWLQIHKLSVKALHCMMCVCQLCLKCNVQRAYFNLCINGSSSALKSITVYFSKYYGNYSAPFYRYDVVKCFKVKYNACLNRNIHWFQCIMFWYYRFRYHKSNIPMFLCMCSMKGINNLYKCDLCDLE